MEVLQFTPNVATNDSRIPVGAAMGRKRKKKPKSQRVAISDAMPAITETQNGAHDLTQTDSLGSISPGDGRDGAMQYVPEMDDGTTTTDELSSDFLSTGDTSLLDPDEQEEVVDMAGDPRWHGTSIYSPSRYPTTMYHENEALFGDDGATLNSTRSLASLDVQYTWENGRRYCGSYYMPNDDEEQVRSLLMDEVYRKAFDGELTSVPLQDPMLILDIGTGTGEWAIDMAMKYPSCEVIGSDISNVFSRPEPVNVIWEIDDAEQEWVRSPSHDLVHFRHMTGAFQDWTFIYQQTFRALKPGGYIELLDFDDHKGFKNFYSFFSPDSSMHKVARDLFDASILSGRLRGVGHLEPRLLYDAGFVDVQLTEHAIPLSPKESSTGHVWLKAITTGLEATALRLLTTYKGWTAEEVRIAVAMITEEMTKMALDPKRRKEFGVKVRVLSGRKPQAEQQWVSQPSTPDVEMAQNDEGEDDVDMDTTEDGARSAYDGESGYNSRGHSADSVDTGALRDIGLSSNRESVMADSSEAVDSSSGKVTSVIVAAGPARSTADQSVMALCETPSGFEALGRGRPTEEPTSVSQNGIDEARVSPRSRRATK